MKKVLIISGHTDTESDSMANKQILNELQTRLLPEAEYDILDRLYPDYRIDVEAEQKKLVEADIIVLQYPVFWYGWTSLMQKWIEDVFQHGFSHGSKGKALVGKKLFLSFTTGAPEEAYQNGNVDIEDLIKPAVGMAALTGLDLVGYVYTCGVSYGMRQEAGEEILRKSVAHAEKLAVLVKAEE